MPNEQEHVELANHNQSLIDLLFCKIDEYPDWITTIAFYKALHVVEAVFANDKKIGHGIDHVHRERFLKENKYSQIYKHYRPLYSASLVARYMQGNKAFSSYMTPSLVRTEILNHRLHQIEASSLKFLKNPDLLVRANPAPPRASIPLVTVKATK